MPMSEFLSCDWGTSNFRLRLVKDGEVVAELSTDEGIDQLAGSGPGTFKERFAARVVRLSAEVLRDLSGLPAVISGMASSSIGWRQLPYATVPFALDGSDARWEQVAPKTYLVSGVASDDDIIRGEETELLGAARLLGLGDDATLVLPGTHAKHIRIAKGQMVGFRTFMTGELFDVLTRHSILRHTAEPGRTEPCSAFAEGVAAGASEPFAAAIFQARTRSSLGGRSAASNGAFLSGVLIGAELAALPGGMPVVLCGGPRVSALYAGALAKLAVPDVTVVPPHDVERLPVLGHTLLLERIHS